MRKILAAPYVRRSLIWLIVVALAYTAALILAAHPQPGSHLL
jgi:hypothetical protein